MVPQVEKNVTCLEYPKDKSIHQLFEESAEKVPDSIAIVYEGQQISYSTLNERANQLARYIRALGVVTESRIGVALPRGIELIVGLLAVLKAGGAYIPLDIDYPQERLDYMLEDGQVKLLLSLKGVKLPENYSGGIVYLDEVAAYCSQDTDNLCIPFSPANLAYITYTSGSTGRPKGVACDHRGVINRLYWGWVNYGFKKDETCCLQSSIAFVDSTWDIFGTLLVGARLVLYKEAVSKNIEELLNICFIHKITRITLIPSFLNILIDFSKDKFSGYKKYLSHWEITGESFKPNLIDHFFKHMGQTPVLLDCYGATEATSVIYRDYVGKNGLKYQTKILSNTQVHLLDAHLNPVSIGEEGEIYIGGVGLARGYLNKPHLTAERFIPNPFEMGGRLYKTGDLGRYLLDGNIEFLGRIDHQLKMRGFRIELGEIEGTIEVSEAVQQAVVLCREDIPGQKRLVAYVVPRIKDVNGLLESLQNICLSRLPDYMQPSQWVILESLPLTPNGKIDRKGLPIPEGRTGLGAYQTPIGLMEEQLAQVWSELLGIEVGRSDNFFRLGGHSLLATQMVSRLREMLRVEVPLRAIFEHRVLSELAGYLEQSHLQESLLPTITKASRDTPQILSFAQQRLWFLEQLLPNTELYHNPLSLRILGKLNERALRQALDAMVARHEILRTVIINPDGIALQKVLPDNIGFPLTGALETTESIDVFIKKPFQFDSEPLCRGLLLKHSDQEHVLCLVFHHIVVDDWSMAIFWKELNSFYTAYSDNKFLSLSLLPIQYIDYSVWQRSWLQGEVLDKQLRYWKEQLREVARLELPTDYLRPKELSYQGGCVHKKLSKELLHQLQAFSQSQGVTLFMSLVASIQGFLSRYCNQTDIAIGTPIANRRSKETEDLIGFFVNTLVLRNQLEDNPNFETFIKRVESNTISAYEHQDVPFEQLVEYLQVSRELNRNPLFQVMFNLQQEEEKCRLGSLEILPQEIPGYLSRFDLLMNASVGPEGLYMKIDYAKELFSHERIERLADCYEVFLSALLKEPCKRLSEIPFLGEQEKQQLFLWNETHYEYPKDKNIVQMFEEQVERTPFNIAVVYEEQEITYQELNERSNQLAHYLKKNGVGSDKLVAIAVERSLEMVVGILAILKAGGAYVPLDASYPKDRLEFMLEDTKVCILLTQSSLQDLFANYSGQIITLDETQEQQRIQVEAKTNPISLILPHHLAYLIYTSGSTGKPKGVMIEHQNLTHYITYAQRTYPLTQGVSLFHGSYAFDMSITSLFLPLIQGFSIGIVSEKIDVEMLGEFIKSHNDLNLIKLTPTHLRALKEQLCTSDIQKLQSILIIGGEKLLSEDVRYWKDASPHRYIVNEYGPTETTVGCCIYQLENESNIIPIGRPIANTEIYILDKALQMVAVGVIGEIYIGGAGLARGYWNQSGLTAERFIPNPFGENTRLYKTGDLARYLKDGNIEFLGRMDEQVKVRGYRIELGEIEAALLSHQDVSQGVVIAREDEFGIKKLFAYVVPGEFTPSPTELREYLEKILPEYMIPSVFAYIEQIPLTLNGKLDHKALPSPDFLLRTFGDEYVAPGNEKERELCDIWSAVLGIEKIGIRDHFFRIGGDSIISIQLVSKARQQGIKFSVKDVFNHPTIEALALVSIVHDQNESKVIQSQHAIVNYQTEVDGFSLSDFNLTLLTQEIVDQNSGNKSPVTEIYPLSPLQTGLLFQALFEPDSDAYFVQSILKLEGEVNKEALQRAWQKVCDHHAILRTGLVWENLDQPLQYVLEKVEVPYTIENWRDLTKIEQKNCLEACIEDDRKRGFELRQAPLFRIKLIDCAPDHAYMIWSSHHVLSDGWSTPIILADVLIAYEGFVIGKEVTLKNRAPYKDYITWLGKQDKEKAREYWQEILRSVEEPTQLSFKRIMKNVSPSKDYGTHDVELSMEETAAIRRFAGEQCVTLNTVLQGAVGLLLQHYTQKTEVVMGVTVSGRTMELAGIEEMVGLFINTLPLKVTCHSKDTVESYLNRLQEQTQQLNDYAYTSLSQIYGWASQPKGLFDVLFVFENYPIENVVRERGPFFQITNIKGIERTEYPLTVVVMLSKTINFIFHYQTEHFDETVIELIAKHLRNLLKNMQTDKGAPRTLDYLSNQEYQRIIETWNTTQQSYPVDKTIHQLFEEQVKQTPNYPAVIFGNEEISYQELNERANQLAYFLRYQGIGPDSLVAIAIERSVEMMVSLLGILKAGGAYVPLDPSYPEERLRFMLEDTKASLLITHGSLKSTFKEYKGKILLIDEAWKEIQTGEKSNPQPLAFSQHLAYVIYTSGSTGKPKGVMISHQGLANRLLWMKDKYRLTSKDRVLQKTPFTFDVSVWELFLPLISGSTEIIASPDIHKEPNLIWELIRKYNVSICHFVPPMMAAFLEAREFFESNCLRLVVASGDVLPQKVVQQFYSKLNSTLHNLYGPTEASIDVTSYECLQSDHSNPAIGRPIWNTKMYILDGQLNPVPVGVNGDLYIGGVGLARGYLNRPVLTAEKFIPNPFINDNTVYDGKNLRLYCTGDLARYLPDGNIEFLGRRDDQVKVRGYRIELGEIESVIAKYTDVSQVVVIAREDEPGQKKLVAYVVAKVKKETFFAWTEDLRKYLTSVLPEYMIPAFFINIDDIPLTSNGKIDRKVLPMPTFSSSSLHDSYVAPNNEREHRLCEIWGVILGIERVGIRDHFFRMGGDSIISIQLVSKARQKGILFSVKDVFNHPTIEALAKVAQDKEGSETLQAKSDVVKGIVPLTPIQHWFFKQNSVCPHHYNQAMWIKSEESIDLNRLQIALKEIYHHHDGFRLRYRTGKEDWEQYYTEESELPWKVWQGETKQSLADICTDLHASLNIEHGPISQLLWFPEKGQLLWVIHHLIVDGVSWRILLEDLNLAYTGKALGTKSHSYLDWSNSLSKYRATGEIEYYQAQLQAIPKLPSDYAYSGHVALKDAQEANITFSAPSTKQFLQKAHQSYGTQPDDLLLLALILAVGDCFGQYQLCVDLEGHGREDLQENLDLTRSLGWFTSMHPVVLTLSEPSNIDHSIKYIKEHLRGIPKKGVSYGILSQIQKNCAFVQGDILFNYLGQWSNSKRKDETFFFGEGDTGLSVSLETPLSHPLIINGGVNQGQLAFQWTYSTLHYKTETIEKLSTAFKERLEALIEYCSEEKNFGFTPSDFPHVKLQGKQLDKLFSKIGSKNNA